MKQYWSPLDFLTYIYLFYYNQDKQTTSFINNRTKYNSSTAHS